MRVNNSASSNVTIPWYAVRTRSCAEFVVTAGLQGRELEVFLPRYHSLRSWSDRKKVIDVPLFPGYVFCKFSPDRRLSVLMTAGVVGIVSCGATPVPIPEIEITSIKTMIESGSKLLRNPYLAVGDRVEVARGPLKGVVGVIVNQKSEYRLVVSVNLLQRSIAVEIDTSMVIPLRKPVATSSACPVVCVG
jgi:transcription antitermination factor NusG